MSIFAKLGISKKSETRKYSTNLDRWLKGVQLDFESIDYASFEEGAVLATVEFDKDNTIYIILPEEVFKEETK